MNHEIPNIHLFYRQARQMVYGILFNLHHAHYLAKSNNSQKGMLLYRYYVIRKMHNRNSFIP